MNPEIIVALVCAIGILLAAVIWLISVEWGHRRKMKAAARIVEIFEQLGRGKDGGAA